MKAKKIISLLMSLVMLVGTISGNAITSSASSIQTITFGEEVSGECDCDDYAYLQFNVPESGKVIISAEGTAYGNSDVGGIRLVVYDSQYEFNSNNYIYRLDVDWNDAFDKGIAKGEVYLKAGTYYIQVSRGWNANRYFDYNVLLTYKPNISKPSIKTPSTNKKHKITAKWKKVLGCDGYQVQFSRKKNFKSGVTTKTVKGQKKTSCTGKFKKGKKYYIRVRAYKIVDGERYYSSWSSKKSIKCR